MTLRRNLLLVQIMALAIIHPTDYSQALEPNVPQRCKKRVSGCGVFEEPINDVGWFECKFNSRICGYSCTLKCPRQRDGVLMRVSNDRHRREGYVCSSGKWKRRDTPVGYCIGKMRVSEVEQNFHHVSELNTLVNELFNTSYFYLGMASFYERADVSLPGFSKYMTDLWQGDLTHARNVMSYINKRGGYLTLEDIPRPSSHEILLRAIMSRSGLAGLESALRATRDVNGFVQSLHKATSETERFKDPHLKHYLEDGIMSEKVETIKKLADLVSRLQSFSDEDYIIGEYMMDEELGK